MDGYENQWKSDEPYGGGALFKNQIQIEGQGKKRKIPDFCDDVLLKMWRLSVLRGQRRRKCMVVECVRVCVCVCVREREREREK